MGGVGDPVEDAGSLRGGAVDNDVHGAEDLALVDWKGAEQEEGGLEWGVEAGWTGNLPPLCGTTCLPVWRLSCHLAPASLTIPGCTRAPSMHLLPPSPAEHLCRHSAFGGMDRRASEGSAGAQGTGRAAAPG